MCQGLFLGGWAAWLFLRCAVQLVLWRGKLLRLLLHLLVVVVVMKLQLLGHVLLLLLLL